jgi:hypothetical protein
VKRKKLTSFEGEQEMAKVHSTLEYKCVPGRQIFKRQSEHEDLLFCPFFCLGLAAVCPQEQDQGLKEI